MQLLTEAERGRIDRDEAAVSYGLVFSLSEELS